MTNMRMTNSIIEMSKIGKFNSRYRNNSNPFIFLYMETINIIRERCEDLIQEKTTIPQSYIDKAKEIVKGYNDPYPHLNGDMNKRIVGKALELFLKDKVIFDDCGDGYTHDFTMNGFKIEVKARFGDFSYIPIGRIIQEKEANFLVIFDIKYDSDGGSGSGSGGDRGMNYRIVGYDIYNMSYLLNQIKNCGDGLYFIVIVNGAKVMLKRGGGYYTSWGEWS